MAMIRKQLYLTAETEKRLKAEAKRRGVSEAQVIRERLDGVSPQISATPRFAPDPEAIRQMRNQFARTREEPKKPIVFEKRSSVFNREEHYENDERMQRLYAIVDRMAESREQRSTKKPKKAPTRAR